LRVCLTGTIGSGKSRILAAFGKMLNSQIVQADQIARELMQIGAPGYVLFCEKFSDSYLLENGSLDRQKLKKAISDNPLLKEEVEEILHPLIRQHLLDIKPSEEYLQEMMIYEVPLLFEVGWQSDFDVVISVYVHYRQGRERLMVRDSIDSHYADDLLALQMSSWQKAMMADMVIDNSYCFTYTMSQLLQIAAYLDQLMIMKTRKSDEKS